MSIQPAIYIMASRRNGTLYIEQDGALRERVYQHREGLVDGFTKEYGVKMLAYFEFFASMPEAIAREKQRRSICGKTSFAIESRNENCGICGWRFSSELTRHCVATLLDSACGENDAIGGKNHASDLSVSRASHGKT